MHVQPWGGAQTLEATLRDATGELTLVFLGRRQIGGIVPGTILTASGVIGPIATVPHAEPRIRAALSSNGGSHH